MEYLKHWITAKADKLLICFAIFLWFIDLLTGFKIVEDHERLTYAMYVGLFIWILQPSNESLKDSREWLHSHDPEKY